jgi:hypothetical protein
MSNLIKFAVIKYQDHPEWDRIDIEQKWSEWIIEGCLDGDVEFSCHSNDSGINSLFLNQDELKQVIEFLQSKILTKGRNI